MSGTGVDWGSMKRQVSENPGTAILYTAVAVVALLLLLAGVRLTGFIIVGLAPVIASSILSVLGLVGFLITIAVVLLTAVVAVAMPVVVIVLCAITFLKLIKIISNQVAALKELLSTQAREATIDATFLAIIALLAGLMFFMATEDFLNNFSTIRVMVLATAVSIIGKMLILIPIRSAKVAGLLITAIVLVGLSVFVAARYHLVSPSGISLEGVRNVWQHPHDENRSKTFLLFAIGTIGLLLVVSVLYPFTGQGWRRIWKVEGRASSPVPTA
jgi:hypothetical protein